MRLRDLHNLTRSETGSCFGVFQHDAPDLESSPLYRLCSDKVSELTAQVLEMSCKSCYVMSEGV